MTFFDDVRAMYIKHGFIVGEPSPVPVRPDVVYLRLGHMVEELAEFAESQGATLAASVLRETSAKLLAEVPKMATQPDVPPVSGLADGGDALIDLAVLALGTGALMCLPINEMWDEVQRANLERERVADISESKRGHPMDLKKPPGWRPPDHWPLIYASVVGKTRAEERCFCVSEDIGHVKGQDPRCMHYGK